MVPLGPPTTWDIAAVLRCGGASPRSGDTTLSGIVRPQFGHFPVVGADVIVHACVPGQFLFLGGRRSVGHMGRPCLFGLRLAGGVGDLVALVAHRISAPWLT